MTTLDDLQRINEYEHYSYLNQASGESLLKKYRIPIQHFDFGYVANARDPNELEKMIEVLRSGQEGYYPDLLRATEEQLKRLRPNSKCLRKACRVLKRNELQRDEVEQLSNDLQKWTADISRTSRELDERKTNKIKCDVQIRQCEPQPEPLNLVKNKEEKRIASTDYTAWDKYDPDTELLKEELEAERLRKEAEKARQAAKKIKQEAARYAYACTSQQQNQFVMGGLSGANKRKLSKSVSFNAYSTDAEAMFMSNRELDKGREFFRSGDYELALKHFSQSILCKANVTNLNNRSLTYLKLNKYEEAIQDCDRVLAIDRKNLKALLRKGQALEGLKMYEDALCCAEELIEKDPNNIMGQELAERVRKFCRNILKNTRMKIIEIE
ncbi:sperm-associated antigen 1 [Anthonomus grandis grandis]|uniref:sperm-associated antigen 1 n=1 Tax=Anthonomus grandis grandis TaxID=2921223 RepID=UPI002165BE26|nr:sperm-associated antigen 1 [Anthonomus grandis grandis]